MPLLHTALQSMLLVTHYIPSYGDLTPSCVVTRSDSNRQQSIFGDTTRDSFPNR